MTDHMNSLKEACHQVAEVPDQELLEIGETVWLAGLPAAATKDTLALRVGTGQIVVVKEADVVEAKKVCERYLVRVRKGSHVIHRFESMSRVGVAAGKCDCHGSDGAIKSGVARERISVGPGEIVGSRLQVGCLYECQTDWFYVYWTDDCGHTHQIAVPYVVCSNDCGGAGAGSSSGPVL